MDFQPIQSMGLPVTIGPVLLFSGCRAAGVAEGGDLFFASYPIAFLQSHYNMERFMLVLLNTAYQRQRC
jgi:hypothetical protein